MTTQTTEGNPRVSLTGYATASAWAYFGFEYADWFDAYRGQALFRPLHYGCRALRPIAPSVAAFTQTLYWRHHWFSAWAERQTPGLAIEIGAGLSTRGISYAERHPECLWVDYDLADMVAARRARLAGRYLPGNYRLEPGDLLSPRLGCDLQARPEQSTIVMTEGVTDYLDKQEKRRGWRHIADLLARCGGGKYLLECHPRDRISQFGPAATLLLRSLRAISGRDMASQLCHDPDEAIALLCDSGFRSARVLDESELDGADRAPPPQQRAFVLIEASV